MTSQVALYTAQFLLQAGHVHSAGQWLGKALSLANQEGTDKARIFAAFSHLRRIETEVRP